MAVIGWKERKQKIGALMEALKQTDKKRRQIIGNPQMREERRAEAERKRTRKPKCCLFKGDIPTHFRPCIDCPEVDSEEGRRILQARGGSGDSGGGLEPADAAWTPVDPGRWVGQAGRQGPDEGGQTTPEERSATERA